ncbi:hypothetical protein OAL43_00810 [bacterium]|nr:hypothetical protein [bacterium]
MPRRNGWQSLAARLTQHPLAKPLDVISGRHFSTLHFVHGRLDRIPNKQIHRISGGSKVITPGQTVDACPDYMASRFNASVRRTDSY